MLEDEGRVYTQSRSILRYLAVKNGFYPKDAETVYRVESLTDLVDEMIHVLARDLMSAKGNKEATVEAWKKMYLDIFPDYLKKFEKRLKLYGNGSFLVGEKLSLADLMFMGTIEPYISDKFIKPKFEELRIIENTPDLKAYIEAQKGMEYYKKFKESTKERPMSAAYTEEIKF